ncbi:unnamed protein product [Lampetra planeri]
MDAVSDTNIPFLQNVLNNSQFVYGTVDTQFIDEKPELFNLKPGQNRAQKLLYYLAMTPLPVKAKVTDVDPVVPDVPLGKLMARTALLPSGFRDVLVTWPRGLHHGSVEESRPAAHGHHVSRRAPVAAGDARAHARTHDLTAISLFVAHFFGNLYSIENWGGVAGCEFTWLGRGGHAARSIIVPYFCARTSMHPEFTNLPGVVKYGQITTTVHTAFASPLAAVVF